MIDDSRKSNSIRMSEYAGPESVKTEEPLCPCGSDKSHSDCCGPFIQRIVKPSTAEALMRSRYRAYVMNTIDYLEETTHPKSRNRDTRRELENTLSEIGWIGLRVTGVVGGGPSDKSGKVSLVADYIVGGSPKSHRERSRFKRYRGEWKYLDDQGSQEEMDGSD
ncbi:MAG TPA: SecC motif-containing protein [Opitutae bacterium]|nr:SecC motif-containing protein [Opitutae bacterium]